MPSLCYGVPLDPAHALLNNSAPSGKSILKVERWNRRLLLERSTAFLWPFQHPLSVLVISFFYIQFYTNKNRILYKFVTYNKKKPLSFIDVMFFRLRRRGSRRGRGGGIKVASRYYDALHLTSPPSPVHLLCNVYHAR